MFFNALNNLRVSWKAFSDQFRRYLQTVFWLYRSLFKRYPVKIVFVQAANFLGPTSMGSALGLLIYFIHKMEKNTQFSLHYLPFTIEPRDPKNFTLFVLFIGIILLASSLITFLADVIGNRLAIQFALDHSRFLLTLRGGRPSKNIHPEESPYPKAVQNCSKNVVGMIRAIKPLLQLFQPLFSFLFSFAAMVYINFILTIGFVIIALPSLFFQYRINYKAAKNEENWGTSHKNMQRSIISLIDRMAFAPQINDSAESFLKTAYAQKSIKKFPEVYYTRIMARPKSQMVSSILISILLLIIVRYLGINALEGKITWALMLGYIVFARSGMTSLRQLMGITTGFARHYPTTRKAYDLIKSSPEKTKLYNNTFRIRCTHIESPGDLKLIKLLRGKVLSILSPVPITRHNIYAYVDALGSHRSINKKKLWGTIVCIPNAYHYCPGASLRELLELSSSIEIGKVHKAASYYDSEIDFSQINVDSLLDETTWRQLPVGFRCHLLLEQGVKNDGDVILVEHSILEKAEEWYRKYWWEKVSNRYVIVRHNTPDSLGHWDENSVMVMRPDRVTALMSVEWAKTNIELLNIWINDSKSLTTEENDHDLDDDD